MQENFNADADELENAGWAIWGRQLHGLEVDVDIQAWKKGSCRVRGSARASMTRTCVVSLEPVRDDGFEVVSTACLHLRPPYGSKARRSPFRLMMTTLVEIVNGEIEVGEFAVEELLLELDPASPQAWCGVRAQMLPMTVLDTK
jgi:hypothetical protein